VSESYCVTLSQWLKERAGVSECGWMTHPASLGSGRKREMAEDRVKRPRGPGRGTSTPAVDREDLGLKSYDTVIQTRFMCSAAERGCGRQEARAVLQLSNPISRGLATGIFPVSKVRCYLLQVSL
jgi:hypothetical protein